MIRGGTTTFADMYYFESDVASAVDQCGMRAVLGETWLDFPVPDHKDLPESIAMTRAFLEKWKEHPRIIPAVAPHAPFTNSKESLVAVTIQTSPAGGRIYVDGGVLTVENGDAKRSRRPRSSSGAASK